MALHFRNLNELAAVCYCFLSFVLICISAQDFMYLIPCFVICIFYSVFSECFKTALFCLPTVTLLILINPLFNHSGSTPLFYVNDNPYTLEALMLGIRSGMMVLTLILWFQISFKLINSNKAFHLLSKILPTTALMLSMIHKSTNDLKRRSEDVSDCRKSFIKGQKGFFKNIRLLSTELLAVSQNALESSVIKGISMKGRGFELKGKTTVYKMKLKKDDGIVFCTAAVMLLIHLFFDAAAGVISLCIWLLLPALYQTKEELKWHCLKSKI